MIPTRFRAVLSAGLFVLGLPLAACDTPPVTSDDYRERHPLLVGTEDVVLELEAPFTQETLKMPDRFRVKRFVRDFIDRGRGMVVLELVGPGTADRAWQDNARVILLEEGLRPTEIGLLSGVTESSGPVSVRLTYSANAVKVPECDDWSQPTNRTPDNTPFKRFGCVTQRNLGLMVKDPGDLVAHRLPSARHPGRSVLVISDYRTGAVTTSNKSNEQQDGFSGSESTGRSGGE